MEGSSGRDTEAELIAALEAGTLPPAEFNHRNHVRAARHYLLALGLPAAAHRFRDVLQAYVRGVGAEGKFHLTLTFALLHLIHQRLQPDADFEHFAAGFPELFTDARGLLARHYSPETLMSEVARRTFVPPDRMALPPAHPE